MTVRMILPYIQAAALHAGRHVAAFSGITGKARRNMAALMTRDANRNGIINLTFTA
jgi:hypothetical protein